VAFIGARGVPSIEEVDRGISGLPRNRIAQLYHRLSAKVVKCDLIFG